MKLKQLLATLALSTAFVVPSIADEIQDPDLGNLQAVSAINGKVETGFVHYDIDSLIFESGTGYYVQGSVSVPLGERFGFQLDAGVQTTDLEISGGGPDIDLESKGVAGHLFWRDPSVGLIGVYGHYAHHELGASLFGPFGTTDIENARFGVEGEYYHNDWTFKAFAGADRLDFDFGPGLSADETFFAGQFEVGYYINDNALVTAGVERSFDQTVGKVGLEVLWDTGEISPTFFANASFSEDVNAFSGGIRIMLGQEQKSLKRRHREDDPTIGVFSNTGQIASCLAGTIEDFEFGRRQTGRSGNQAPDHSYRRMRTPRVTCDSNADPRMIAN